MPGITTYARVVGVILLALAAAGATSFGWKDASIFYHVGVGLLFLYVGFSAMEPSTVRQVVGGLGVLLVVVKVVTILVLWVSPIAHSHGPIQVSCLVVGIASVLAARHLPDQRTRRGGRIP